MRGVLVPWPDLLAWHRAQVELRHDRGSVLDRPVLVGPCEMVVTCRPGTNGRELVVRCRCMAGTRHAPSRRFYGYDPIGYAAGPREARDLWDDHRAARAQA